MEDGIIQLIVIGVFVVISMLEGVTRKKRPRGAPRTTRSQDPLAPGSGRRLEPGAGEADTSEGLVPDDVWEEIAALARGEPEARGTMESGRLPEQTGRRGVNQPARPIPRAGERAEVDGRPLPVSTRPGREERAELTPFPREPTAVAPPESTLPERTRPQSLERARAREMAREVAKEVAFHQRHSSGLADLQKDEHYVVDSRRSAMRRFFGKRGGRGRELRRAILLSEILGPPLSLREPRRD